MFFFTATQFYKTNIMHCIFVNFTYVITFESDLNVKGINLLDANKMLYTRIRVLYN